MTTATDYYFINAFKATEDEINKLGENFDVSTVFHALSNIEPSYNQFLVGDFNRFDRAKIDIFLHKVADILADADIDMNELEFTIYYANGVVAEGFKSLAQIDEIEDLANKAGVILK